MSAARGKRPQGLITLQRNLRRLAKGKRFDELFDGPEGGALAHAVAHDWCLWARDAQLPPDGDWITWLLLGGRGAGKTRAGAEWVRGVALGHQPFAAKPVERIALVGETFADAREVMVEGVSGLLQIGAKWDRPQWQPSRHRLEWPNGAVAQLFSATDPEGLRGPQFGAAWSDEIGKWRFGEAAWDMLQFALRLGEKPRQVVTTTPHPTPLVKRLLADATVSVGRMATRENAANLAAGFLDTVVRQYKGTRLGRQELDGDLIEDRDDALWQRDTLDRLRVNAAPELRQIVVAIDPPASSGPRSDACGIVAAGIGADERGYVLADATLSGCTPDQWAGRAVALFHALGANLVVAEVNQGGEMVTAVLREADRTVPVKPAHASRGKWTRAEPVSLLYAQERVSHVGTFALLEDEMCNFTPAGTANGHSPDRIDALVWALTELLLVQAKASPRVRRFQ